MVTDKLYDLIIVGGGPAGLAAGLYAGRAMMDCLILEGQGPGGQVMMTHEIENYPGFIDPISGGNLSANMYSQTLRFGVEFVSQPVRELKINDKIKTVRTSEGAFQAKAVIIATGVTPRLLSVPGEAEYTGRGVSYCATCDGAFFRDKTVAVVGGGDTAVKEALFLTKFAKKVYLIHRRDQLRAEPVQRQRLLASPKIEPIWNTVVGKVHGDGNRVTGLSLNSQQGGRPPQALHVDGVFVFVGRQPMGPMEGTGLIVDTDGYIKTDEDMQTNLPGVYAVGDVRSKRWRQIVTAVSDGCIAALSAAEYIEENFREED
ncbi:MAG: thioredoxin-disulfide reductase [Firmicutes bacterium]|nr:thioredoxin-disulfide reductase [Bacillota bacterium]